MPPYHEQTAYQPQFDVRPTGGHWYISDEQYRLAAARGMRARSDVAAKLARSIYRGLRRLL